jgi:hypothetical protein
MAQPLNARGTFFGGGNRGLGTIIRREEQGTFADSGLRVAQRMKAEEEKAKTKRQEKLDELQDFEEAKDIFAPYLDTATGMINEIIDEYANGRLTDAELAMRVNDYKSLVYKGNQMKDSFDKIVELYEKDPTIDATAATKWARKQAAGDGSREYLTQKNKDGLSGLGFLDEEGGSAFLVPEKVISEITTEVATDIKQMIQDGDTKWLGGNISMTKEQMNLEFSRLFEEEYTNEGVKFKLRDPNSPEAKEIIDSSLLNKKFSRIVYDQLREDNPEKESFTKDEARNKAIRILGGYSDTKIETEDKTKTMGVRWKPERRAGGKGDDVDADERRTEWYKHLMSGQPDLVNNALNYLTGTTNVPFTDLREIISSDTLASLNRTYNDDDLTSASFDIKRGYLKNGEPTVVLVPRKSISKKGGLWGTGLFAGSLEEGRPIEVSVDLNSSQSQEFWNNYYNIANTYSTTGEKAHYNENKGGQIGGATPTAPATPTTPSAPTTSTQSGGGKYDNIGQ